MRAENNFPSVLLIDDQAFAEELVRDMFYDEDDIRLHYLPASGDALSVALAMRPTVVLVDLRMPLVDGFGVTRQLRSHPETSGIPVILLSSEESAAIKAQAFAEGANDYLVKWPDRQELIARVRYHSGAFIARMQRDEAFLSLERSQGELLLRTRELAQSREALHQAQKMEAIGQLTGGIAHDINNVLQVINGNLELLRYVTAGNSVAQKRVEAALAGVNRGAKLCSHLLAFARRQPLQSVVIDTASVMHSMVELLRRSVDDLMAIDTAIAEDLWPVSADPSQLENVILNLAINARDAMNGQGTVTISARNVGPDESALAGLEGEKRHYVLIEVADTGAGMAPEVLERAFEPFFTTKPSGQGTGLGLSMAYGFARQSGGDLRLESEVGRGTRVKVFLPKASGNVAPAEELPDDQASGGIETILVVEDEPGIRSTTVDQLTRLGYKVLYAEDAASALRIIEDGAHVDLLLCDVVMPGPLRSTDLAQRASGLLPAMQVLFTSGYSEGIIAFQGNVDPRINLLQKPYGIDALSHRIRHLLQKRALTRHPH